MHSTLDSSHNSLLCSYGTGLDRWVGNGSCYTGDEQLHVMQIGVVITNYLFERRFKRSVANATAGVHELFVGPTNVVFEEQLNLRLVVNGALRVWAARPAFFADTHRRCWPALCGRLKLPKRPASPLADTYITNGTELMDSFNSSSPLITTVAGGCPANGDLGASTAQLTYLLWWSEGSNGLGPPPSDQAVWVLLDDCSLGGVAWEHTLCNIGGNGVTLAHVGNEQERRPWVVFAHELGHVFGARHSEEWDDPSTNGHFDTLGIMDYETKYLDIRYKGNYQFNAYRRSSICETLNASFQSKCGGTVFPAPIAKLLPVCGNEIVEAGESCECAGGATACAHCTGCALDAGKQCSPEAADASLSQCCEADGDFTPFGTPCNRPPSSTHSNTVELLGGAEPSAGTVRGGGAPRPTTAPWLACG